MKPMTSLPNLNTALTVLIALLLADAGLALWVEKARSAAVHRSDILAGARERIYGDVIAMSDALRGQLLDPKNDQEKKRWREAESNFKSNVSFISSAFHQSEDLLKSVAELHDFVVGPLAGFHKQVTDLAETDSAGAAALYARNCSTISRQGDQLLHGLALKVERFKTAEETSAQTTSIAGWIGCVLILLASLPLARMQSAAMAKPLNHLAAAARQQQDTAREIAAATRQIGATSSEISTTSGDLVKTLNEINQVSEDTANLAGSSQAALARTETTMRQLIETSSAITASLAVLSEKTTNISSVITAITKVADQTNLLSLNAAIEAEKAGEYGLGFAVVAMEIRRLADQTAVAACDIEKMVKEMCSSVASGVAGLDKFSEEVRRGIEEVRQISAHLAQIIHQSRTLAPRFQTVNAGMHAQAAGACQISETLTQLGAAARQTAESLRQSDLAIEQLNGAARDLGTSVARFKAGSEVEVVR